MGVVSMTFYREGKKMSYLEVIEILNALITKDILLQLEEREVYHFYLRILEATREFVTTYLEVQGYKVTNMKQAFVSLAKLKVISDISEWNKALRFQEDIQEEKNIQDELVSFMIQSLPKLMRELNHKIEK